jgi:hypothetical protein
MSHNHEHKPDTQSAAPSLWDVPGVASSPFFTLPTPASGGMVPRYPQMPETTPQPSWPGSPQPGPVTDQPVEQGSSQQSQAPQQQAQGQGLAAPNLARLQRLCRRLRETHRCPGSGGGGCVLSRARQDDRLGQFPDIR